jgi:hypothetical protein
MINRFIRLNQFARALVFPEKSFPLRLRAHR